MGQKKQVVDLRTRKCRINCRIQFLQPGQSTGTEASAANANWTAAKFSSSGCEFASTIAGKSLRKCRVIIALQWANPRNPDASARELSFYLQRLNRLNPMTIS